ncbi:OmpA family protein [Porphyromonas catoniae]|jgi:immunogenic 23 kDa lipoprotein PG3|uniref:OmpA family protein n=1 Tax=Porphyromonas catoniae ATCC 51270 TaxID=887901 RepID=Z4WVS9_9PORP|nr:OmpA family protein [Porphyromonas catoniae]EWC91865.1 OmpA family protein [Porphyromonas catoniae ATCC 51270]
MLNKKAIAAMLLSGGLILSGCGLSNTAKGAGIGAGAGAIIGAGVGRVAGNTALGAIIGGVVGGTAGTLIGKKMDKQKKELEEQVKNAKIESVNEGQAIRVTFDSGILFATNSSTLSSTSQNSLRSFAANLKANSQTDMLIIGHTDNTGSDRINDPLSLNRASSVRSFLSAQGVDSSRMRVDGKGSHEPVADNSTASGRKENRRVEVYIIPNKAMVEAAQNGTLK